MNWVDFALIGLVALSVVSGIREGFSRSGFGFLAILAAFLAAAWVYPEKPAGFLIVFVLVICGGAVATAALGRVFRSAGLKGLDRVLGGAMGLTNALLISVFAVVAAMTFAPKIPRHYVAHSAIAPYAVNAAYRASDVVPEEMKSRVEASYVEMVMLLPPKLRRSAPPLPHSL
jgi:membrane protein required for colicin V production